MKSKSAILGTVLFCTTAACAQTPGFWLVGPPPGGTECRIQALSQDGTRAAGYSVIGATGPGFLWSAQGGREDFGLMPGMPPESEALAISTDGSILAGMARFAPYPTPARAYRRVASGPLQDLGVLPSRIDSIGVGISGDGSTVVGYCSSGDGSNAAEAFRWTESGGMQGLGYLRPNGTLSKAYGISRDGSTIVGSSQSNGPFNPYEGFVWTEGAGMRSLPTLPGAPVPDNDARAASANGSVIVGSGSTTLGRAHAVRWSDNLAIDLGTVGENWFSIARAVSDDGSVIGGSSSGGGPPQTGFVWTSSTGMLSLRDYVAQHGLLIPSTFLPWEVDAVSGDGLTFAGYGLNQLTGLREGYVVTIPSPGSSIFLLAPLLAARRERLVS